MRKSSWLIRSPNTVPGAITGTSICVALFASGRPMIGAIWALLYGTLASTSGPGRLWNAAARFTSTTGILYVAYALKRVWKASVLSQNSSESRAPGVAAAVSQRFPDVRPVLSPPATIRPLSSPTSVVRSNPFQWRVCVPNADANVVRRSTALPTASGLRSITGPTSYPPPPGSRGSTGAVTVNCAKSDSGVARFCVTTKLPKIRRK